MTKPPTGRPKGFAAMTPERRREIAAKGGASVAPENRSFYKDRELAVAAGRTGGHARNGDKA